MQEEIKQLMDEKNELLKEMHDIKMKQWTTKAKQVSKNLDIPKEWREGEQKRLIKQVMFLVKHRKR